MNEALTRLEEVKIALCVIHEVSVVIYPSQRNKPASLTSATRRGESVKYSPTRNESESKKGEGLDASADYI